MLGPEAADALLEELVDFVWWLIELGLLLFVVLAALGGLDRD